MKAILSLILVLVVLVSGVALGAGIQKGCSGGTCTEFGTINSVTNTTAYYQGDIVKDMSCYINNHVGTADIVYNLQGGVINQTSGFANLIPDTTIKAPDSETHFVHITNAVRFLRFHIVSGTNVTNTIDPYCIAK